LLIRLKIVKCLDVIMDVENNYLKNILEEVGAICGLDSKIFIHRVERRGNEIVDVELIYTGIIKEVLHHNKTPRGQP